MTVRKLCVLAALGAFASAGCGGRQMRRILALTCAAAVALAIAAPAHATSPGRNGKIVFSSNRTGSYQLYTIGPSGGGLRQVTHLDGDAVTPDWSPDGRWIAFELDTADGGSVALMRADGSHMRMLPNPPGGQFTGQPSFTPGGGRIVFGSFNPDANDAAIWIETLRGRHQHRLATGPAGADDPNVSPDGRWLTFVAFNRQDFGQGLIRTTIRGTHPKLLLPYSTDVAIKHDWSPDGRRIGFSDDADRPVSANVATVTAEGADLRRLTHLGDPELRALFGSYSPDGQWIVYRFEHRGHYTLVRMHPDGSHKTVIRRFSNFPPRYIDWGPTHVR
jgi:Tol biopolymer transport system component